MLFDEKTKLAAPGEVSGQGLFSALSDAWKGVSSGDRPQSRENQPTLQQDIDKQNVSPALHGPIDTLKGIRRRILTNIVLAGWTEWSICIFVALIVAGAVSTRLTAALILAVTFAVIGAAAIFARIWRTRLSTYETACRLDAAAGLQDRISTAIYLGDTKDPDGMFQRQRDDAIARLTKVEARGLFPIRKPAAATHALALVLVVGALFVYRMHHKPPMVALLETSARSSLVQSIFTPIVHAMERDLERTMALVTLKADPKADEVRPGEALANADDLWQSGDDKKSDPQEAQPEDSLDAGDPDSQDAQGQGDQAMPSADAQPQEDANGQPQQANAQSQSDSQNGNQSLAQSMMQALKNMVSKQPNQPNDRGNQQQNSQASQQSGGQPQESDKQGNSRANSDQKQDPSKSAGNGAGNQQGTNDLRKDVENHPVNAVPDKVALDASGFKDQTRMRVETETGTAHLAVHDVSSQTEAVINGAEQENIPARYRLYVQRYFEHANDEKQ